MPDDGLKRRDLLKFGLAAAGAVGAGRVGLGALAPGSAGAQTPGEPYITGFRVEIDGAPLASRLVREIAIDELNVDVREMTTGLDVEYRLRSADHRLYGPGAAHWGSARLTFPAGAKETDELRAWFAQSRAGSVMRKDITVILHASDGTAPRGYKLVDCCPTQWSAVNFDTSSTVQTETLTVKMGRVEFKT